MIQDLHTHTFYSFCSDDTPEQAVEAAIAGGVQMLGICDHSYGVGCARTDFCYEKGPRLDADYGKTLRRYHNHIKLLKEKYKNRIKILSGIEICTLLNEHSYALPSGVDVSFFDYCLVENLDHPNSLTHGDIFSFAKRCGCPTGIAHTDLFAFLHERGEDPYRFFRKMAEQGIFWEMNVNYDSVHSFKTYEYVSEFLKNKQQQEIVKKSGVRLSVGFDGHAAKEYKAMRVKTTCNVLKSLGFKLVFEER